jgi:cyclophilin family peptidyl-prolyl cis-trans isomerase
VRTIVEFVPLRALRPLAVSTRSLATLALARSFRNIDTMSKLISLAVPLLALCSLVAQQGDAPKQEPKPAPKQEAAGAAKDDPTTAGDPAIKAIDEAIAKVDRKGAGWKTRLSAPPKVTFVPDNDYFWHMETECGTVKIKLHADTAPVHAANGIYLARMGFYDGLSFHRVIPQFMAQGGCPEGNGRGGPGYKFGSEFQGGKKHDKAGILSMAHAGEGTDGSQFFITFCPTPHLDNRHTVWGETVEGLDVLKKLEGNGSNANNGMLATPLKINKTWISVAGKKAKPAEAPKDGDKKEGEKK